MIVKTKNAMVYHISNKLSTDFELNYIQVLRDSNHAYNLEYLLLFFVRIHFVIRNEFQVFQRFS